MSISPIDTIIIAVYLVGIIALGVFAGFKKNISSEDQFLGGRLSVRACSVPTSLRSTSSGWPRPVISTAW